MATEFSVARSKVENAAGVLFETDPLVRSVGIGAARDGFGYIAVRNTSAPVPLSGRSAGEIPHEIEGIPVQFVNSFDDPILPPAMPISTMPPISPARFRCCLHAAER
jgi:hypothetical protein